MKKKYYSPSLNVRFVNHTEVVITSDPQISDDPTDGGAQLIPRRDKGSDWDNYE